MTRKNQHALRDLRALELPEGACVLLIKEGTPYAQTDKMEALGIAIEKAHRSSSVVMIVVENFTDLSVVDEDKMKALGWVRA